MVWKNALISSRVAVLLVGLSFVRQGSGRNQRRPCLGQGDRKPCPFAVKLKRVQPRTLESFPRAGGTASVAVPFNVAAVTIGTRGILNLDAGGGFFQSGGFTNNGNFIVNSGGINAAPILLVTLLTMALWYSIEAILLGPERLNHVAERKSE